MGFVCFLLVNATLFLRPAEIVPALRGLPIYEVLILSTLVASINPLRRLLSPGELTRQPVTICVLGMLVAVVLSHAAHAYLTGVQYAVEVFIKTLLYYLVLVAQVDSPRRFRIFALTVCGCSCVMVGLCVIDYFSIVDFDFITHIADRDGVEIDGSDNFIQRMRGTGIFQDPNDISLVIMAAGVLCVCFLDDVKGGLVRVLWVLPAALLLLALLCTKSRGGLLCCGAAALTIFYFQRGRWTAIGIALAGICALPVVAGRQGSIELEGGTSQERIQLWSEGLAAIRSTEIFFGTGMGTYSDIAGLVAHNSFVHSFVELGLFGGTLFFGCFFFSVWSLHRAAELPTPNYDADPDLWQFRRMQPYVAAATIGWAVGLFALSRCYVAPTYMVIGMAAAYINVAGVSLAGDRPLLVWDRPRFMRLIGGSVALFVGLNVFVKLFARF